MSGAIVIAPPAGELVRGITNIERYQYDEIPAENWSGLKPYAVPEQAYWREQHPMDTDTDALKFGRRAHLLVLQSDLFYDRYVEIPVLPNGGGHQRKTATTTKEEGADNKKFLTDWKKQYADHEWIDRDEWALLHQMRDTLHGNAVTAPIFNFPGSLREVTCLSQLDDGAWTKSQLDMVLETTDGEAEIIFGVPGMPDGVWIGDYKTARFAQYGKFKWAVRDFGYRGQAGFYVDNYERATGVAVAGFFFVAQEKQGVCSPAVYIASKHTLRIGRTLYNDMLRVKAECKRTGVYPGYAANAQFLDAEEF